MAEQPDRRRGPYLILVGLLVVAVSTAMLVSLGPDHVIGNRPRTGVWAPVVIAVGSVSVIVGAVYTIRDWRR